MPPKKKTEKNESALNDFQRILDKVRKDPKYKNKPFKEQQQIASKIYQKL